MSRGFSNYKRQIRAHKRAASVAHVPEADWMSLRALGGCRAAKQWCQTKGVKVPRVGADIPERLRDPSRATTWWVIRNQDERSVHGPIRVEPNEWTDQGLTAQDLAGPHGTAASYYSEAEAAEEAAYNSSSFAAWNEEDDRLELERLGLGPL